MLAADGECEENEGKADCSHICVVTYNGHICQCPPGYELASDHKTCQGKLSLLYKNPCKYSWRLLTLPGRNRNCRIKCSWSGSAVLCCCIDLLSLIRVARFCSVPRCIVQLVLLLTFCYCQAHVQCTVWVTAVCGVVLWRVIEMVGISHCLQ